VAQSDGYKPREERGWEEFHHSLDIDYELPIFSADQVDGISPPESTPSTPRNASSTTQYAIESGVSAQLEGLRAQQIPQDIPTPGLFATPKKRGPGRPPRKTDSMLHGLGSPPRPRINPLPTINPKERLNLPKATMREVDPFKEFEESDGVKVNYVDRTMANIGYQESEVFARPEKSFIRVPEGNIEEDLDLKTDGDGSGAIAVNRVEYDMDEQDDRWLENINAQRREEAVEPIKPAIFEVTITQIEKEWHALEKRTNPLLDAWKCEANTKQAYPNRIPNLPRPIDRVRALQRLSTESLQDKAKSRTRNVQSATTATAKIQMRSFSAMDVTWLCIKNATECRSSLRGSGFVDGAS
jgi:NuA3 HAT complex component NTO1